jgi:hypothetical protein
MGNVYKMVEILKGDDNVEDLGVEERMYKSGC